MEKAGSKLCWGHAVNHDLYPSSAITTQKQYTSGTSNVNMLVKHSINTKCMDSSGGRIERNLLKLEKLGCERRGCCGEAACSLLVRGGN